MTFRLSTLPILGALAFGALALAGCLPNPPAATPTYEGLTRAGQAPGAAATSFPISGRGRTVGLLATNGTEKALEYIADAIKTQRTSPLLNSHYRADAERFTKPTYLFDTATSLLRQRFGKVVQINDLNEAARRGLDYVAVLDLKVALPTPMSHAFSYDMSVEILDRQFQKIGTIRGAASEPFGSGCYGWGDAVIDCGMNTHVKAIRDTADRFRSEFAAAVR